MATERWPTIPVSDWQETRDTLHLSTEVVGKIRLANEPLANHWWRPTSRCGLFHRSGASSDGRSLIGGG
jgi:hypothetical protein